MIHKRYDGIGCLEHATERANKILKEKSIGSRLQIRYLNGYANFLKTDKGVIIAS